MENSRSATHGTAASVSTDMTTHLDDRVVLRLIAFDEAAILWQLPVLYQFESILVIRYIYLGGY